MNKKLDNTASVDEKLRASRLELLDIGLRNNLVSFRKNSKSMTAYQADAAHLLEVLIDQQKKLTWVATGKARQGDAETALDTLLLEEQRPIEIDGDAASAQDFRVSEESGTSEVVQISESEGLSYARTPAKRTGRAALQIMSSLSPEPLFLQLLKLRSEANTLLEEQGANLLFLAVGFLHWFESDSAQEARRAPLVLVPVTLVREGAGEVFEIEPTGDDVVLNLSLAAKLKTDFGIHLPIPEEAASSAEQQDGLDYASKDWLTYLDTVEQAIKVQKRWKVQRDETVLGLFSFGKFLMFKDLASESWPEGQKPEQHPVLGRLMGSGFADVTSSFAEDQRIDEVIAPGEVHFVKDADSSQTLALLEACAGNNLVIQGPPGTGKSQTITNLIAELLGQKKTILFVAEKMAALEVVKRRLDECHLGDSVLELHSHRATKAVVLKELGRTLELGRPIADDSTQAMQRLKVVQAELNQYCEAVATPVGGSGQNFSVVLGQLLQLQRNYPQLTPLVWPDLAAWPDSKVLPARDVVERMALVLRSLGKPQDSVFWGTDLERFSPIEENQASTALAQGMGALEELFSNAQTLSQQLMLTQPAGLEDIDVVCRAARRAAEAPKLEGIQLSTNDWQERRDALKALIQAGRTMRGLRDSRGELLINKAWQHSVMPMRQAIASYGDKWWRAFSGEWRAAKKQFQGLLKTPQTMKPDAMLAAVDDILAYQEHKVTYDAHVTLGEALFGAQWQAGKSDWDVLERVSTWIVSLHDEVGQGELPQGIVAFLSGHPDASGLGVMADAVSEKVVQLKQTVASVCSLLGVAQQPGFVQGWQTAPLADLQQAMQTWQAQLPQLQHVVRLNTLVGQGRAIGLEPLVPMLTSCEQPDVLLPLFDVSRAQTLVEKAYREHPVLAQFDRLEQEHRIAQFRKLDLASLNHSQSSLASALWQRMPRLGQPGEMAILNHELNKKRRHIPIRQLIGRAGRAIQKIKPVFMMSPMSIANFLPPGRLEFDVVIFDEASQVKAVDALGAIMRGKQVIVVGDTRQMPPTDFFSREVEQEEETATSDIESILSMFKARGCNERYLRWHYRSRHESLIAVSNAEFYDDKLVIFPSAGVDPDAVGISLTHLPQAMYDRGRTRTNKGEAQAVAFAVIEHAARTPHLSLGVAAFSVAQRDLIEVEVEMLRRQNADVDAFFTAHPNEPFFVKNLENIQGDERDVMFISIGYGRNESGRIAKEFGPLNRDGGHRRLNVLITRAKLAMRVFSNFKGDELELDSGAKHGVRALKNLLKYAETRQLEVARETGKATDSPFEDQVLEALRGRGYSVEPQVGTSGYFIDMAVRDPDFPGRYILAIECDGAAYHSARSARDRDRLRQGVLEGLGWRFHRIWSTDWFRNQGQEIERAIQAIEAARQNLAASTALPEGAVPQAIEPLVLRRNDNEQAEDDELPNVPYAQTVVPNYAGRDLLQAPRSELNALIQMVIENEAPVHFSVLTKRVMQAYDLSRSGVRINACVMDALNRLLSTKGWTMRDEFIYTPEHMQEPLKLKIRDRSMLGAADKKLELVSPCEIQSAIFKAVEISFSLPAEAVPGAVVQWLGFGRVTAKMQTLVEQELAALEGTGVLGADAQGNFKASVEREGVS